jgi:hypothetical protein
VSRTEHFFHGTTAALAPGDLVTPANARGVDSIRHSKYHNVGSQAFATPKEVTAWQYAFDTTNREPGTKDLAGPRQGRARVYAVEPVGSHEKGPEYHELLHQEYVAPAWRVRHELLMPQHAQGALPNLNWNQFRTDSRSDTLGDANSQIAHLRGLEQREREAQRPEPEPRRAHGQRELF